jgi:hypothetical protein
LATSLGLGGCATSSSGGTRPLDHPIPAGIPLVVGLDAGRLVVEGSHYGRTVLDIVAVPGGPSLVAPSPAGGWVVTYTPNRKAPYGGAPQRLAMVSRNGKVTPFGPAVTDGDFISGIAVAPDGRRVAIASFAGSAGAPASRISILATPGHRSAVRTWRLGSQVNEAISLSWSPDGRTLSYIAGYQTGAGVYAAPSFLDLDRPGHAAPSTSPWSRHRELSCQPAAVGWISAGRYAVLDECRPGRTERFRVVHPRSGRGVEPSIRIGKLGCFGDIHAAGRVVLVSWCDKVYKIVRHRAILLPDQFSDAAPAGGPARAPGG